MYPVYWITQYKLGIWTYFRSLVRSVIHGVRKLGHLNQNIDCKDIAQMYWCMNAKCKSCVSHNFHKGQPQIVMWKVLPRLWLSYLSGLSCQLYLLSIQWDWNIFEVALQVSRSQKKIVEPQLLPKDKQTNLFYYPDDSEILETWISSSSFK